ncbi:MAG: FAD-binding oxidoreductase, partial [Acidimicrobiales bacterium]
APAASVPPPPPLVPAAPAASAAQGRRFGAALDTSITRALAAAVGAAHVLVDPDVVGGYTRDWTGRFAGPARLVVRPGTTDEVAHVLRTCLAAGVPVVVQGGNTGLVGASVPPPSSPVLPVLLSTTRLSAIGPVDTMAAQVTAGAGATLDSVQAAARDAGLMFPVDLAARESATIGGMAATNAGGVHVLRYGTMRRQVVGAEAVLADGRVLSHLGGLAKDNTGYDWPQLLVGSEGTLGVLTAVRLRLVPRHRARAVALVGVDSTAAAVALAVDLRGRTDGLSAAEVFYDDGLELVCRHGGIEPPFAARRSVYLLIELEGGDDIVDELAAALADADTEVDDQSTALSGDEAGIARLWTYRERHTEAVSSLGVPHKLDVTLPLGAIADFEPEVRRVVEQSWPGAAVVLFGHVGDGNLHVNVVGPPPQDETVDGAVLELVASHGGSISAEHGVGRAKVAWLGLCRSPAELSVMRAVKSALDPDAQLNPGVLFPGPGAHDHVAVGEEHAR